MSTCPSTFAICLRWLNSRKKIYSKCLNCWKVQRFTWIEHMDVWTATIIIKKYREKIFKRCKQAKVACIQKKNFSGKTFSIILGLLAKNCKRLTTHTHIYRTFDEEMHTKRKNEFKRTTTTTNWDKELSSNGMSLLFS